VGACYEMLPPVRKTFSKVQTVSGQTAKDNRVCFNRKKGFQNSVKIRVSMMLTKMFKKGPEKTMGGGMDRKLMAMNKTGQQYSVPMRNFISGSCLNSQTETFNDKPFRFTGVQQKMTCSVQKPLTISPGNSPSDLLLPVLTPLCGW